MFVEVGRTELAFYINRPGVKSSQPLFAHLTQLSFHPSF
jgi:hypothetical protein